MESVNNSGTFAEVSFPRLLVHLHQDRFDGTLRVTQQGPVKLLYFQRGEIAMASSNDSRDHLAPILIREGKLKSEQLDLARKSAKPGTSLARVLVQMGFLTSGEPDPQEPQLLERAGELYRALGDSRGEAEATCWTGIYRQVVLLEVLAAIGANHEQRVVGALHEFLLD